MLRISPGKEKEFRYFQQWLAASAAVDEVINATEQGVDGTSWQRTGATDNALSRRIDSLNLRRDLIEAGLPQPFFGRPAKGGTPCGSTCT